MARTVDEPWRHADTQQLSIGHERLHTTDGIFAVHLRRNRVEDSMSWNRATLQTNAERGISCARCALRLRHVPRHSARMTYVSTPSSASGQEALKRLSLLRDNDFTAKVVSDMSANVEGRKPRKKKAPPQPTIVHNTVHRIYTPPSLRSSPTIRRWRLLVWRILQTERMRVRREDAVMMEEEC